LKVFYDAFVHLRFGLATAAAWLLGAMLIGLTALQMRRLASVEYRAAQEK
jgi:multiple sugar transport system permease protein